MFCCCREAEERTSGVPADEEFSDFIIDEDEETVGEGAEPPARPGDGRGGRGTRLR